MITKTLFDRSVVLTLALLLPLTFGVGKVIAQESDAGASSSLLKFENEEPSRITITAGETITLKGSVQSLIDVEMTVELSLVSDGSESGGWVVEEMDPPSDFLLPATEGVPYEFKVRFLEPGSVKLQPSARILEIPNRTTPIDSNSPDCPSCLGRGSNIVVTEGNPPNDEMPLILAVGVALPIAAGAAISGWYFLRKSRAARRRNSQL